MNNDQDVGLEYDENGNIMALVRTSEYGATEDDFEYTYDGNQLVELRRNSEHEAILWPGDADNNGIVDQYDLLAIQDNLKEKVYPRNDDGLTWQGCVIIDNGNPALYADCNGDGIVDHLDEYIVNYHFGNTHAPNPGGPAIQKAYSYDANGNMVYDEYKQMHIVYNHMNLPVEIVVDNVGTIKNYYSPDGTLLMKEKYDENNALIKRVYYNGVFRFVETNGIPELEYIFTDEGYITLNGGAYEKHFIAKDHLGNTRVVYNENQDIEQENAYYPFGKEIDHLSFSGKESYPYQYNEKEMEQDFFVEWLDYGWRMYDPALGRWHCVDPLAKAHESPYAAFANNPIMFVDPDGRDTTFADNQARNDFKSALNTVNSKVSHYQQRVDENKALANEKGFGAALKRFFRNEKADAQNLANWQKLESDFDNITDPNTAMVEYSSSTAPLGTNENGLTQPQTNGDVKVNIRAGHISVYIHENRHVNQWFSRTSGLVRNTDLFDEIQAFQYQAIFDPSGVQNLIIRGAQAQHGTNWQSIRPNYGLTDLVKYLYPGIIQSTTDVK